jgi:hypothetical protein
MGDGVLLVATADAFGAGVGAVSFGAAGEATAFGFGVLVVIEAKGSPNEGVAAVWAGSGGCVYSAVKFRGGTWIVRGGTCCARSISAIPAAAISAKAAAARIHPATPRVRPKEEREIAGACCTLHPTVSFTRRSVNAGEGRELGFSNFD